VLVCERSGEPCVAWVAVVARADGTRVGPPDLWAAPLPSWPPRAAVDSRDSRLFQDVNSSRLAIAREAIADREIDWVDCITSRG
jgi:hypothetical protein